MSTLVDYLLITIITVAAACAGSCFAMIRQERARERRRIDREAWRRAQVTVRRMNNPRCEDCYCLMQWQDDGGSNA